MTKDKLLDKLQKLRTHADSAEKIGNQEEAQAFAAMFQKLLLEHHIEMTDLEFETMEREQPVEKHMIDYDQHGIPYKRSRVAWMERLASIVAKAHYCRILVHPGSNAITLVGRHEDIAVAEFMYVTLVRAIQQMAKKEHMKYCWETYKRDGHCHAAAGFKEAFIQSFIMRLAERYDLARRQAESTCTALVRLDTAVEDFMKNGEFKKCYSLARMGSHNGEGHRRGRRAADEVDIHGKAVGGGDNTKLIR